MSEKWWWFVARSSGIVATIVLVASLGLGVLLATRALRGVDRPAWLLAMHRWFSVLTVAGTAIHVGALVADDYVPFGWMEILVPFASRWRRTAVGVGVIAMYLLVGIHVSSLLMKRMSKSTWRRIHMLSYGLVWSAVVHGALAGSDAGHVAYQAVAGLLTLVAVNAGILRVVLGRGGAGRAGQGTRGQTRTVRDTSGLAGTMR